MDEFAYEKWWATVNEEDRKLPPECLCPAAWNAALTIGEARGRVERLREALGNAFNCPEIVDGRTGDSYYFMAKEFITDAKALAEDAKEVK